MTTMLVRLTSQSQTYSLCCTHPMQSAQVVSKDATSDGVVCTVEHMLCGATGVVDWCCQVGGGGFSLRLFLDKHSVLPLLSELYKLLNKEVSSSWSCCEGGQGLTHHPLILSLRLWFWIALDSKTGTLDG